MNYDSATFINLLLSFPQKLAALVSYCFSAGRKCHECTDFTVELLPPSSIEDLQNRSPWHKYRLDANVKLSRTAVTVVGRSSYQLLKLVKALTFNGPGVAEFMLLTVLLPKLASQSNSNNSIQLMGPINMNYKPGIYRLNHVSHSDKQATELQ